MESVIIQGIDKAMVQAAAEVLTKRSKLDFIVPTCVKTAEVRDTSTGWWQNSQNAYRPVLDTLRRWYDVSSVLRVHLACPFVGNVKRQRHCRCHPTRRGPEALRLRPPYYCHPNQQLNKWQLGF